jgi:hypothetical protein
MPVFSGARRLRCARLLAASLLTACALLAYPTLSGAQMTVCPGVTKGLDPSGFETLTISTVAIGLTAATITAASAAAAYITLEVGAGGIRYAFFGTPTAGAGGHLLDPPATGNADPVRGTWICGRAALLGMRAIRSGAADATLRVSYFTER